MLRVKAFDKILADDKPIDDIALHYALRAYEGSRHKGLDKIVVQDVGTLADVEGIVAVFRDAGVERFVFAEHSTIALRTVGILLNVGCEIAGFVKIQDNGRWGEGFIDGLEIVL